MDDVIKERTFKFNKITCGLQATNDWINKTKQFTLKNEFMNKKEITNKTILTSIVQYWNIDANLGNCEEGRGMNWEWTRTSLREREGKVQYKRGKGDDEKCGIV